MVIDLVREYDKEGDLYLIPKQVDEMMKQLVPMVEKCDTEYPTLLSNAKGMLWTYYHQAVIDQGDLIYVTKKMENLNKRFKDDCNCIRK